MNALLLRLANGEDVVNDVIELKIPLAKQLASKYIFVNPTKSNDIESEAFLGLVRGVNWLYENPDGFDGPKMIGPFLNTIIITAIKKYLNCDYLIPVPRRSMLRSDVPLKRPTIWYILHIQDDSHKAFEIPDYTHVNQLLLEETKEDFIRRLTVFEQKVLNLRFQKLSQTEIARRCHCSVNWINKTIIRIKKKYNDISVC